jgi:hypothetical protein
VALVKVALSLAAALLLGGGAVHVTVTHPPGHTPKINVKWFYTVRVTRGGRPVAARLTEQMVDPLGGKHPVEVGPSTKKITNLPIKGVYRDYIIWPKSARGIPLTFRVIVTVGSSKKVVDYHVVPR